MTSFLADPTLAYIFLMVGLYAVVYGVVHPGFGVAGLAGCICLGLAAWSFHSLPLDWLGLVLLISGAGLVMAEAFMPTHGVLAVVGVASLLWGSFNLYPGGPEVQVAWWAVLSTLLLTGGLFWWAVQVTLRAIKRPALQGKDALVGCEGKARTALNPEGTVQVDSEEWSAVAEGGVVAEGEAIEVLAQEGNRLKVRRKA
jgi:membrane-bound serine protease (ClpP class)